MEESIEALLRLLTIAINRRPQKLAADVDWWTLLQLAQKQGICGLVYEALEIIKKEDAKFSMLRDGVITTMCQAFKYNCLYAIPFPQTRNVMS